MKVSVNFVIACMAIGVLSPRPLLATEYLLAMKEENDECQIVLWMSSTHDARRTTTKAACPDRLHAVSAIPKAYYLDGDTIVEISLDDGGGITDVAKLPDMSFKKYSEGSSSGLPSDYVNITLDGTMKVVAIGASDDGNLWVHAEQSMAADDTFNFLLKLVNETWVVDEFLHCGTYEYRCSFDSVSSNNSETAKAARSPEVYDLGIRDNEFFVRDDDDRVGEYSRWTGTVYRYFEIAGIEVSLEVLSKASGDFNWSNTHGLVVHLSDDRQVEICDHLCRVTLTGRYLLAQRYRGHKGGALELYDLASGESVLGDLGFATWVQFPEIHQTAP